MFRVRGYHPLWRQFPQASATFRFRRVDGPTTPGAASTALVWASARSLATTCAIIVIFFSSGYLDVSVPRVRSTAWPPCRDHSRRVSPFGYPRVNGYLPLTAAFRSLSRPSSPPRATGIPHAPFLSFLVPFALLTSSDIDARHTIAQNNIILFMCRSITLQVKLDYSRFSSR